MNRKRISLAIGGSLVSAAIVLGACAQSSTISSTVPAPGRMSATTISPAARTTPSSEKPQYGGTLNLCISSDPTAIDPDMVITSQITNLTNEDLWEGDWTKGPAGGYGTNQTNWRFGDNDIWSLKAGFIAKNWKWTMDSANNEGTLVYEIRQGVHYALNPNSAASNLVGGREVTADDVVYCLQRAITDPKGYLNMRNPELHGAQITKTGPWEVTIKVPLTALTSAISRFGNSALIYPPEVVKKYGNMEDWNNSVGTGAFMLTSAVPSSEYVLKKNPNYWMKNPIGPGKGDQLPYLDGVNVMVIPDASTRDAAIRTAKIDWLGGEYVTPGISVDEAGQIHSSAPWLIEQMGASFQGRGTPAYMPIDKKPFTDVRVRQALCMAINFNDINQSLYQGNGETLTWTYGYTPDYKDIYLGLDDPEFPQVAKDLFTYHPNQAKELLKEAGYPNGFNTSITITSAEGDYYSIIKEMLSKIGVNLALNIVDPGVKSNIIFKGGQPAMITFTTGPAATWDQGAKLSGTYTNLSDVHSAVLDKALAQIRLTELTDQTKAMQMYKTMLADDVMDQAYVIPSVEPPAYLFYTPWIKNYDGEITVGYDTPGWEQFAWLDAALKSSMGY